MKQLLLILSFQIVISNVNSQTLKWSQDHAAGLTSNEYYFEKQIVQSNSDTITVIGRGNTASGQRLDIIKYDLFGNLLLSQIFGGDSVVNNTIVDYKFDNNNNVYILSKEKLEFYKSKIVLQKYSLTGNLIWVRQIQNPADTSYIPHSLGLANDSNLFFATYKEYNYPNQTDSILQLYLYNSEGNQLWKREFSPSTELQFISTNIFIYNHTAYLFGSIYLGSKMVAVDVNNNLTINIANFFGGFNKIQIAADSNLLITAVSDYRLTKIDLNGSVIWTHNIYTNVPWGNWGNIGERIQSLTQDSDGNIYATGIHFGEHEGTPLYTNRDILTTKYDINGNLIWSNRFVYGGNNVDEGNVILLKNGQVYVGGRSQRQGLTSDYDYVVIKIDSASGTLMGDYRYNGLLSGDDEVTSLYVFDNNDVVVTGLSYNGSSLDWTTQLLSDLRISVPKISWDSQVYIYPNLISEGEDVIVKGSGIKSYSIVSPLGQIVQQNKLDESEIHSLNIGAFSKGVYFLLLETDEGVLSKKIIVN
jgi:hypothetical protein